MDHRDRLRRMVDLRLDRRLAGRVDASDVLQEAYLDAAGQLERYLQDRPMSLFLWLRFLTSQRLMAIHRRHLGVQKRDPRQEIRLAAGPSRASFSGGLSGRMTSPSMAAARAEIRAGVQSAVEGLETADREILMLRHFEELSNQEAAELLGVTPAAASKRYVRALERLKKAMACPR